MIKCNTIFSLIVSSLSFIQLYPFPFPRARVDCIIINLSLLKNQDTYRRKDSYMGLSISALIFYKFNHGINFDAEGKKRKIFE